MKLIPVIERAKWRKIGGVTKGQRWNFDPAVNDHLYVSPEVGNDLVKSGHWQVYEEPKRVDKPVFVSKHKTQILEVPESVPDDGD